MSAVLSLIGWTFLPNFVTSWVQHFYYSLTIRAGDPKPHPGSPRYAEHRRRIHILVVALYLAYTLYEADHDLRAAGDFFSDLGVAPGASDRDVKSRFRRLAALHHPDKASDSGPDAARYFMHLKTASETLTDPARRFAYERFGPDVVAWARCSSVRDYVARGVLQGLLPHYAAAAAAMYVFGLLGYLDWGRHYRWLALAALCLFEVHAATRPRPPALLARVVNPLLAAAGGGRPPLVQFQLVALLRRACVALYAALSRIGPLVDPRGQARRRAEEGGEEALREGMARLEATAAAIDTEARRLLEMELVPYAGDADAVARVPGTVRDWLVQNTIRADPMVKDALAREMQRRKITVTADVDGSN